MVLIDVYHTCVLSSSFTLGTLLSPVYVPPFRQAANSEAADMLEDLAKLCAVRGGDGSVFKERGFKNAAGVLRRLGTQITNIQQLKVCDGLFQSVLNYVQTLTTIGFDR